MFLLNILEISNLRNLFYVGIFSLFQLFGCKTDLAKDNLATNSLDAKEKTYVFSNLTFNALSQSARDLVIPWESFSQLMEEAQSLHGETTEGLRSKIPTLVSISDSLMVKIPDTLNTRQIQSRLLVCKTRLQLLDQELNKSRPDTTQIQTALNEFQQAINTVIIQLNQHLIKSSIDKQRSADEKKELEKQKQFLDSVYKAELTNTLSKKQKQ